MSARVVIAGGGVAAVEGALGVRELAPEGARTTVVAPAHELLHHALGDTPLAIGRAVVRHPLPDVCRALGVELVDDLVASVDADAGAVTLREGGELAYDALLVAVGARRVMSLDHAVLFGSTLDAPAVEDLLALVGADPARRLVAVVPDAAAWSLPAYEVALRAADAGGRAVVVSPEERPAEAFGEAADAVEEALRAAGVERVRGRAVGTEPGRVVLDDQRRVPADGVVALPWMRARRLPGLPAEAAGFVPTDPWCAVDGVRRVHAAGDCTTFPIRQSALGCQQAAVAAASIARRLGADAPAERFSPVVRGALPTPAGTLWLEHDLGTGAARASYEPLWDPPERVAGVRLPAFLRSLPRA